MIYLCQYGKDKESTTGSLALAVFNFHVFSRLRSLPAHILVLAPHEAASEPFRDSEK